MCQAKPDPLPLCPHHAREAVREWLQTQSQVTGYWRDLLVAAGDSETLIAALDDHAAFLRAASAWGEGGNTHLQ